ncbi:MAG: NAD(P)-binding domain-containing protein, partial [Ginsengibacter sp.]
MIIKQEMMKIVMIGAGNTATILSKLMINRGHEIIQVLSRDRNHAKILASVCKSEGGILSDS